MFSEPFETIKAQGVKSPNVQTFSKFINKTSVHPECRLGGGSEQIAVG